MPDLLVMSWLWAQPGGKTQFRAEHVNRWAEMVRANCTLDIDIACVTATPDGIDPAVRIIDPPGDFEGVRIPSWNERQPQCLRRIALFRPDAAQIFGAERFVSMDLDCIVTGNLDPLWDHGIDFRMFAGTSRQRPYNGSMIQMNAGARSKVYTEFSPARAKEAGAIYVGSDQAWISHCLGAGEAVWREQHGVYWHNRNAIRGKPAGMRLMFFPGRPKPWDVRSFAPRTRWIVDAWRPERIAA